MFTTSNDWKESQNGNYYCGDATVFHNGYKWQIVLNRNGVGYIVGEEYFDDPEDGMERADEILDGADCILSPMKSSLGDVTTSWKQQKTVANGSPTFGRKQDGQGVSVKKAKSGKWYYVTHSASESGRTKGWFNSAEEAMSAYDMQYR
jgi:hypothetical protein